MQRDILRDGILIIFLCLFIYQVLFATKKVLAKEKAVKTRYWYLMIGFSPIFKILYTLNTIRRLARRLSSEDLDFPVVTACPMYCYELGLCNTSVGITSLDTQFMGLSIPDENGIRRVFDKSIFISLMLAFKERSLKNKNLLT